MKCHYDYAYMMENKSKNGKIQTCRTCLHEYKKTLTDELETKNRYSGTRYVTNINGMTGTPSLLTSHLNKQNALLTSLMEDTTSGERINSTYVHIIMNLTVLNIHLWHVSASARRNNTHCESHYNDTMMSIRE